MKNLKNIVESAMMSNQCFDGTKKYSCKVKVEDGEKVFCIMNTIEYPAYNNEFGVIIDKLSDDDIKNNDFYGFTMDEIDELKIGEQYISDDYGPSAQIVRLA